jgi:hypothetical protein
MNSQAGNNYIASNFQLVLHRNLITLSNLAATIYYRRLNMFAGIMEKAGKLSPYAFLC